MSKRTDKEEVARVETALTGPHILKYKSVGVGGPVVITKEDELITYCGRRILRADHNHIADIPGGVKCPECLRLWAVPRDWGSE